MNVPDAAAAWGDGDDEAQVLDGGLTRALAALSATRGVPRVEIDVDPRAEGLEDGLVVRLVRELLANAVRHAGCTRVHIEVTMTAGLLTVDVEDDGCGIDRVAVREILARERTGLAAARERVELRGGGLDLLDAPLGGAHIHVRIPVDPGARPPARGGQPDGTSDR